jgi:hypothetical protein
MHPAMVSLIDSFLGRIAKTTACSDSDLSESLILHAWHDKSKTASQPNRLAIEVQEPVGPRFVFCVDGETRLG